MIGESLCCLSIATWFVGATVYYSLKADEPAAVPTSVPGTVPDLGPNVRICPQCRKPNRLKPDSDYQQNCGRCKYPLTEKTFRAKQPGGRPLPEVHEGRAVQTHRVRCPACHEYNRVTVKWPRPQECGACGAPIGLVAKKAPSPAAPRSRPPPPSRPSGPQRLAALMDSQPLWWTFWNPHADILVKHNTPHGSALFAWPTPEEAEAWREHLRSQGLAPPGHWTSGPMPLEELKGMIEGPHYDALVLGEQPGSESLVLRSFRR